MTEVTEKKVISILEAARFLGISRNTAYRKAKAGRLPGCVNLDGYYRVYVDALKDWKEAQLLGQLDELERWKLEQAAG